jgi:hypothetical protein
MAKWLAWLAVVVVAGAVLWYAHVGDWLDPVYAWVR